MKGSAGLEFLVTILLLAVFGSVVMPAHCRSKLFNAESTKATTSNSTSIDESKVYIVFCTKEQCGTDICFCCQKPPARVCYKSDDECKAHCPPCNPRCQFQLSVDSVMASHSSNV
ncbi:unnamed protein product [Urochloa decumbens]|uniref:Bowman-Birk serine protease inhibitors family domain-containing protein n=1 Tax=Urochloa decumbens TaxID=240449 RepID=A0ABC9F1N4_9POAL